MLYLIITQIGESYRARFLETGSFRTEPEAVRHQERMEYQLGWVCWIIPPTSGEG